MEYGRSGSKTQCPPFVFRGPSKAADWLAMAGCMSSSAQLCVTESNRSFFFHKAPEGADQIIISTRFWQDVENSLWRNLKLSICMDLRYLLLALNEAQQQLVTSYLM